MTRPRWAKIDGAIAQTLETILPFLPIALSPLCSEPEQSDALGINSSNFRLNTPQGGFLLKRWSHQANISDIKITLSIMTWLATRRVPAPAPVPFRNGEVLLRLESSSWSLFPFIEGNYFSGEGDELIATAEATGHLMQSLAQLPAMHMPSNGPAHMAAADGALLLQIHANPQSWDQWFGMEDASSLAKCWPMVLAEWEKLSQSPLKDGLTQAAHFDLHPHNLIVNHQAVVAVLDFEACQLMPVGYALAFAALKQCRQAMTRQASTGDPRATGNMYLRAAVNHYTHTRDIATQFGDLAICEVLRRICIILRLNVESSERKWNKVLPIQLTHLREARALFG